MIFVSVLSIPFLLTQNRKFKKCVILGILYVPPLKADADIVGCGLSALAPSVEAWDKYSGSP